MTAQTELVQYDALCSMLARAKTVEANVKVASGSDALRSWAKRAKNLALELDAVELRVRAERNVGKLIAAQRETVGLANGGDARRTRVTKEPEFTRATLLEAGIDKNLANRARRLSKPTESQFERHIKEWRSRVEAHLERVTLNVLRAGSRKTMATPPAAAFDHWTESALIEKALKPAYQLADDWPDGQSYRSFIHQAKQLVKYLERLESRHGEVSTG